MKKVGIIGFFDYGKQNIGGGVMKTRNYESMLKRKYGDSSVLCLDRQLAKDHPRQYLKVMFEMFKSCGTIVIMPTEKMLRLLLPVLLLFRRIYKYRIVYSVVGGWLPQVVVKDKRLGKKIRKLDAVYVETQAMVDAMSLFKNVAYMPNFSMRKPLSEFEDYEYLEKEPIHFCTFSRITKEKGIFDAINAVAQINRKAGHKKCDLTVYGQVWSELKEEFEDAVVANSDCVVYGGILSGDNILAQLSRHYMLLFPTCYPGEGFPGTLVESLMAGLPVIASDWKYNSEIIENEVTGYIYNLDEENGLVEVMNKALNNRKHVLQMREKCIETSRKYSPESVLQPLFQLIESQ